MIRKYREQDRQKVVELLRLNTPAFFAPSEEVDYLHYLDKYADNYHIFEEDGEVIGCGGVNYSLDGRIARISWDIFHPSAQGKGYGTQLLKHRVDMIRATSDAEQISVRTSQLVYKFYEKFGFKLIEIIADFWAPGFDLYRMELTAV